METNYPSPPQAESADASRVFPLFVRVQSLYLKQFRQWFAITAPTSVVAAVCIALVDAKVREIFRGATTWTDLYYSHKTAEAIALRSAGLFFAWFLGCFALGAIATVVSNLDLGDDADTALRDSHQRAREHLGGIFLIAIVSIVAFLIGIVVVQIVFHAVEKVGGRALMNRKYLPAWLIGYVIVASIVSWLGMAVPLVLRGNVSVWKSLKKSIEASDGSQGFLCLLVGQSLVGSYLAWFLTFYALRFLVPAHIRLWIWYGWIELLVFTLASAAVQPPMFIGFSLLAEQSTRLAGGPDAIPVRSYPA